MIIKSMSRKTASFGQLLGYLNKPERKGEAMTHNLTSDGDDASGVVREFLANARRLPPRRRGNILFHEVLSFAPDDQAYLTPARIGDLTRRYLELRAPRALAFARAHFDAVCPHVHIVVSANNVACSRRLRMSRSRFSRIKRELEGYQVKRYPQLRHSVAHRTEGRRQAEGRRESERLRRQRKQPRALASRKELLKEQLLPLIRESSSETDLEKRLEEVGQQLYYRGGQAGIIDKNTGRRHRFRTLGVEGVLAVQREHWKRVDERMKRIERTGLARARREWAALGFREAVALVLAESQRTDGLGDRERKRMVEMRRAGVGRVEPRRVVRCRPTSGRDM